MTFNVVSGFNKENVTITDPTTGRSFLWTSVSIGATRIGEALAIIERRLKTRRKAIDAHFRSMKAWALPGGGKSFTELLEGGISIYFCPDGLPGQVAFSVLSVRRDAIAITQWGLANRSAEELAGAIVHECAHLNGIAAMVDGYVGRHIFAWDAPAKLGLPTGLPSSMRVSGQ